MDVFDFDDRNVCERLDTPTFMVELWSWSIDSKGDAMGFHMTPRLLRGCDVREALAWCDKNKPSPGSFVLFAGVWTNLGYFKGLWLAGRAPGEDEQSATSSATAYTPPD
ncbi:hypothetical protein E1181_02760 [Saccharopolyspora terrae]|uniref:Uncharacterized protein n=1 Tax=Saccharopolyspora terrae TaxID=2530384 RepID=A0A4R4VVX0_9PSEU|nr:hypothetical protein [Saccharopolyspora terrae]TDD10172.1 hypothetical protein E1181_02760 [Saccharopolyspora terrae]